MQQNTRREKEELQKGTKNARKKKNEEKHCCEKEEKTLKKCNEMSRKGMRRLAATDDPRPMSVSLQPLNKQLSMKDKEKRRREPG